MTEPTDAKTLDDFYDYLRQHNPELAQELDEPNFAYELARTVLRARREQGLTQSDVAERAGMTQQQIADIERMNANPTLRTIERLYRALGLQWSIEAS